MAFAFAKIAITSAWSTAGPFGRAPADGALGFDAGSSSLSVTHFSTSGQAEFAYRNRPALRGEHVQGYSGRHLHAEILLLREHLPYAKVSGIG